MDKEQSNYEKYRGKCREYCEAAIKDNPSLTLVRGHYFCPIWNTDEPHWWTVDKDGKIYDPTRLQFPSHGHGIYTPFNGIVTCAECGKELKEEDADFYGNYAFCSSQCQAHFVGIY